MIDTPTNLLREFPVPLLVVNEQGKVIASNNMIADVFLYDDLEGADLFAITGKKLADIKEAMETGVKPELVRNEKNFRLVPYYTRYNDEDYVAIMFMDITAFTDLKVLYNSEKPFCIKVVIDNYDEITAATMETQNLDFASEINTIIRTWFEKFNATITRIDKSQYLIWCEQASLAKMVEAKFDVLDKVRTVETGTDFPASLSIGVGVGGKSMPESEDYANRALGLAQGRGGDQAVVKRNTKIEYFGGRLQSVEKSNKGKSRIVGHALKLLIDQAKDVYIMGHKYADMDSFGAAIGVYRLCEKFGKEAKIVIDEVTNSLQMLYDTAVSNEYRIVNSQKALEEATENSLLIVVDTHRVSLVQCPGLLDICEKVAIIDHHRRAEDCIENATLAYIESYASSASELVSEILQFMTEKRVLTKFEAEALITGIMIDTDRFAAKTGVRTFEAASWLKRQGADTTSVKRFLQESFDNVKIKALAILKAQVYKGTIAITTVDKIMSDAQIMCAQIADQLLALSGVGASFVLGQTRPGHTVISARSIGDVNVQVIMEKFGGGGHMTVAAAQLDQPIEDVECKILEIMEVDR